jgi:peptide/nickel transport system substrate-binding protein
MEKRRTVMVGLFFMALVVCGLFFSMTSAAAAAPDKPKYGGSFVVALNGDPVHLNRAITSASPTGLPCAQIFNSLLKWNLKGELEADLAESWEISSNGLIYTFHLVKNATWHDGKPFTSADVKFSIEEVLLKYNPSGKTVWGSLAGVDTPDPYTAVVRLKTPFSELLEHLTLAFSMIVPKHLYQGTDILKNPHNMNPVGTGPFKFREYVQGSHITLVRNENYFKKGMPYLSRVVFKIIPDSASRVAAFEKGEIDYLNWYACPLDAFEGLKKIPGAVATFIPRPQVAINRVQVNCMNPPLNDVKVRQAMAHAINKQDIVVKAMYGLGLVANGPAASTIKEWYNPGVPKYDFDLAKANKLLDEAGYPKKADGIRFKTDIVYDMTDQRLVKTSEVVRLHLREVGIDVALKPGDTGATQTSVGNWNYGLTTWIFAVGPAPSSAVRYFWSKDIRQVFGANTSGYKNSRFDTLYESYAVEPDAKKRKASYSEMQQIIGRELPHLFLAEVVYPIAYRSEFAGLPEGGNGFEPMEDVWWTKGSDVAPK